MATATKRKPAATTGGKKTTPASDAHFDEIPIARIDPSPSNPRTEFDDAEINQLAKSIGKHGLLQPVIVRRDGARYQLVAGDRRLRAAQRAGRKSILAVVRDVSDGDALILGLIENIEREDLNPADTARAVARLCAPESEGGCGMSQVDAGATLSRDASWVRRQLQLLKLPGVWLKRVAAGELNVGMSHALVQYAERPAVLARIEADLLANPWSWRTVDDFERNAKLLADGDVATHKPSTPSGLKPRRAAPDDGERKRETARGRRAGADFCSRVAGDKLHADGRICRRSVRGRSGARGRRHSGAAVCHWPNCETDRRDQ